MAESQNAIIMTIEGVRTRASTNEALVTFAVPLENAVLVSHFMGKVGRQVGAAFADVEPGRSGSDSDANQERSGAGRSDANPRSLEANPTGQYRSFGQQAKALKLSGFFRCPEVWYVLGTDEEYLAWVRRQKSAWSGEFSAWVDGEGRCEAAHVRRIETGAGMQIKNVYAAIPLTHEEHRQQSERGESVFTNGTELGRDWMERKRIEYVEKWAWDKLKAKLGYQSMADVPTNVVYDWASGHGVENYLPKEYQHAAARSKKA